MKNHQHPFFRAQRISTSVSQQDTLSRRGMLLSIIGLLVAGCGQETTGITLPVGTHTSNPTPTPSKTTSNTSTSSLISNTSTTQPPTSATTEQGRPC